MRLPRYWPKVPLRLWFVFWRAYWMQKAILHAPRWYYNWWRGR